VLGVEFNDPTEMKFTLADGNEMVLNVAFSKTGPMFYEMIEATGDGIFSPDRPEGLHHVGLWEDDPDGAIHRFADLGVEVENRFPGPDGSTISFYADPANLHGVRVEFVDSKARPDLLAWIEGGEYTLDTSSFD
jgi:hypothetical protein